MTIDCLNKQSSCSALTCLLVWHPPSLLAMFVKKKKGISHTPGSISYTHSVIQWCKSPSLKKTCLEKSKHELNWCLMFTPVSVIRRWLCFWNGHETVITHPLWTALCALPYVFPMSPVKHWMKCLHSPLSRSELPRHQPFEMVFKGKKNECPCCQWRSSSKIRICWSRVCKCTKNSFQKGIYCLSCFQHNTI